MRAETLNANRFVLDTKTSADLRLKVKQDPQAGLKQAAREFEGMLLQMVMKSMRDATPQDGLLDSDQTRFYSSILDQQLAQTLSSQGKLGFARMIEQQLGRNLVSPSGGSAKNPLEQIDTPQRTLQQILAHDIPATSAAAFAGTGAQRYRSTTSEGNRGNSAPMEVPASGREFVNRVWPHAVEAANTLGVPPHFLVAHSALESGWGKSEIRKADGSSTYNIFGIKAGRGWSGASVEVMTTEYVDGVAQAVKEKFRAYNSYYEAFQDYASLLRGNSRYAGVVGQQNGAEFARSLQQAGYATDPMYADKLNRIINGTALRQALFG